MRANLIARAEDWPRSSLRKRLTPPALAWLQAGPVLLPENWSQYVDEPHIEAELAPVRQSVKRGCPFGSSLLAANHRQVVPRESSRSRQETAPATPR